MDEAAAGRRPTRIVVAGLVLFVLAIIVGRLLLVGGAAWALLAFLLPVVVIALGAALGFRLAVVLTVLFTGLVLLVRWLLALDIAAWIVLMLLGVVAFTALVVGRVLGMLREGPRPAEPDPEPSPEP